MALKRSQDTATPLDLDGEEDSPYLRRQKVLEVRRGRVPRRTRRMLRWFVPAIIGTGLVVFAGYRLGAMALSSERFALSSPKDCVIEGNRYVAREEILSALGFTFGGAGSGVNLFQISLEEKRRQVEAIPWVRSASVTRAYPHRLVVRVTERTPVAFVAAGRRLKLIDGDGVLLERPEKASFAFPVLRGLDAAADPAGRQARLALYRDFMEQISEQAAGSAWLISEVNVADADDLKAVLAQAGETILAHFGHGEFGDHFHDFLTLLPVVRREHPGFDSLDLRYRNQILVSPKPGQSDGRAPMGSERTVKSTGVEQE